MKSTNTPEMTPADAVRHGVVWSVNMCLGKSGGRFLLDRGAFWFRQGHIFASPFYYIDYTLAQVWAFHSGNEVRLTMIQVCGLITSTSAGPGTKSFLKIVARLILNHHLSQVA